MRETDVLQKYLRIIHEFTEGEMSASEFSRTYVDEFLDEEAEYSEETSHILQSMFVEAEAYCENPELRDERDNDEAQLSDSTRNTGNHRAEDRRNRPIRA